MISIDVIGDRELARAVERLSREAPELAREAVGLTAYTIEADAKRACPVDTGRLRSSIGTELMITYPGAVVGTNVHYAPYVEFGTTRQRAQPYLTPAAEAGRRELVRRVSEALRRLA